MKEETPLKPIKKRGAVYGVIALMLCAAVYLNWSYIGKDDSNQVSGQSDGQTTNVLAQTENGQDTKKDGKENSGKTDTTTESSGSDYFTDSRLSRQKARDEAISILKETTENDKASESDKEEANKQISALADNTVKEARIESLVKAKGYTDCVVFINDSDVNVIVSKADGKLEAADVSKIKDIILQETSVTTESIKIVEAGA
jgi:stage III sporulation protein AH